MTEVINYRSRAAARSANFLQLRSHPRNACHRGAQRATRILEVVVGLQTQPEAFAGAEGSRQPQRGVGADPAFAENDLVDAARWHVGRARQRVLAERHWLEKILQQDLTGVDVGQLVHG